MILFLSWTFHILMIYILSNVDHDGILCHIKRSVWSDSIGSCYAQLKLLVLGVDSLKLLKYHSIRLMGFNMISMAKVVKHVAEIQAKYGRWTINNMLLWVSELGFDIFLCKVHVNSTFTNTTFECIWERLGGWQLEIMKWWLATYLHNLWSKNWWHWWSNIIKLICQNNFFFLLFILSIFWFDVNLK